MIDSQSLLEATIPHLRHLLRDSRHTTLLHAADPLRALRPIEIDRDTGDWHNKVTGEHGNFFQLFARLTQTTVPQARKAIAKAIRYDAAFQANPGSLEAAKRLWKLSQPLEGTEGQGYFARLGLERINYESLRFLPSRQCPNGSGMQPCIVAAIEDQKGNLVGVQLIYFNAGPCPQQPRLPFRETIGACHGGVIKFGGKYNDLLIGESVEDTLAAIETLGSRHTSGWACVSPNGFSGLDIEALKDAPRVNIVSNDDPVSLAAANHLSLRFRAQHRDLSIFLPGDGAKTYIDKLKLLNAGWGIAG